MNMKELFADFSKKEIGLLKRLKTPQKIQDYLDSIPFNFEKKGDTCMSPRRVMRERKAQCMEGAMFAACALSYYGEMPLLLDLRSIEGDFDHVVALFMRYGHWGAISKTNHGVLRYREPVYKNVRELAMSYFHEYFLHSGVKTMRSFSKPFNLAQFNKKNWMTSEEDLWYIPEVLDASSHEKILTPAMIKNLRKAHSVEIQMGKIEEWKRG